MKVYGRLVAWCLSGDFPNGDTIVTLLCKQYFSGIEQPFSGSRFAALFVPPQHILALPLEVPPSLFL
jgi:hypothetical protein